MSRENSVGSQALGAFRLDFWTLVMVATLAVMGVLLVWPLLQVLGTGFVDAETQSFTLDNYVKVLTHRYYLGALWNTILVGVGGMIGACLLGCHWPTAWRATSSRAVPWCLP